MRYFDTNHKECLACASKHTNCMRCSEDRCSQCRDGYFLDGRTCVHCHKKVENCKRCNSNGCIECEDYANEFFGLCLKKWF
mmetsp:Transcript_31709/g.48578  ORF Transcript_31709/g.48578 Transcript_31709/m.48578 type:complete len:81 (+) Transcript_31709:2870-3112(+)